ncbi:unnamed protein product, partial [Amoebophrya sp. A25]
HFEPYSLLRRRCAFAPFREEVQPHCGKLCPLICVQPALDLDLLSKHALCSEVLEEDEAAYTT